MSKVGFVDGVFRTNNFNFSGTSAAQLDADGKLIIGDTGANPVAATLTAGANITITPAAGAITIASTASGGLSYSEITDATKTIVVNEAYGANKAGGVAFTLPAAATIGDEFEIVGMQGNWSVVQGASQYIKFGNIATTTGAGGSLTATDAGDCIKCRCIVTDVGYRVASSIGNITVV